MIHTESLGKRFGDRWVLRDVDLDVPRGAVLGLLGPNGAGKTTTARILTTLLRPDAGRASVAGHDVVERDDAGEPAVVHHRQAPDAVAGHELRGLLEAHRGAARDQR